MTPTVEEAPNLLGWLAVVSGYITDEQLEACVERQKRQPAIERQPLGAALVEDDLLSEDQLAELLARQQSQRGEAAPALSQLTDRQNHLLGRLLIDNRLIDADTLERCRHTQEALSLNGELRKIGEILIDEGTFDLDRLKTLALDSLVLPAVVLTPGGLARRRPPPTRELDWDRGFSELAQQRGLIEPRHLDRLAARQTLLMRVGLGVRLDQLAVDLKVLTVGLARELGSDLCRRLGRNSEGQLCNEFELSVDHDPLLLWHVRDSRRMSREDLELIQLLRATYDSFGVQVPIGDLLLRLDLAGFDELLGAIEIQSERRELYKLWHGVRPRITSGGRGRYQLKVVRATRQLLLGRTFRFDEGDNVLVGRALAADLRLYDLSLSKVHAQVSIVDGRLVIRDLGSTNGTVFNGELIETVRLGHGDYIWLGDVQLHFTDLTQTLDRAQLGEQGDEISIDEVIGELHLEVEQGLSVSDPSATDTSGIHPVHVIALAAERDGTGPRNLGDLLDSFELPRELSEGDYERPPAEIAADGIPSVIHEIRGVFREFYARTTQLAALGLPAGGPGGADDDAPPPTVAEALEAGLAVIRPRRPRRLLGRVIGISLALCLPLMAAAGIWGYVVVSRHRRQQPAKTVDRRIRVPFERPPPPAAAPLLPDVGERTSVLGRVVWFSDYQGPLLGRTNFALVLQMADGRQVMVHGSYRDPQLAELERYSLEDVEQLEVFGIVQAYVGPPARLPDQTRTPHYVQLERYDILK